MRIAFFELFHRRIVISQAASTAKSSKVLRRHKRSSKMTQPLQPQTSAFFARSKAASARRHNPKTNPSRREVTQTIVSHNVCYKISGRPTLALGALALSKHGPRPFLRPHGGICLFHGPIAKQAPETVKTFFRSRPTTWAYFKIGRFSIHSRKSPPVRPRGYELVSNPMFGA